MQTDVPSRVFDLALPALELEGGGRVDPLRVRGWWWGLSRDIAALEQRTSLRDAEDVAHESYKVVRRRHGDSAAPTTGDATFDPNVPTVLVVHALSADMRAGDDGGWWSPLIGPGRALDPTRCRILCFNNLGGCYGTSGPADEGFPTATDARFPAPITTWDQARAILAALDALGIERIHLAAGASLGGMILLALAALAPRRFERIAPIAACEAASAWIVGLNHVARQIIVSDPAFPNAERGLEIARQLAMLTYRAEPGLHHTQGRLLAAAEQRWHPDTPYRIGTYLEHQGKKLRARFDVGAYLAQLGAMDHHDLARVPRGAMRPLDFDGDSWGLAQIEASTLAVRIDTDQLYLPAQTRQLVERLRTLGRHAEEAEIQSAHGHDAFLIEWEQLARHLTAAFDLPSGSRTESLEISSLSR